MKIVFHYSSIGALLLLATIMLRVGFVRSFLTPSSKRTSLLVRTLPQEASDSFYSPPAFIKSPFRRLSMSKKKDDIKAFTSWSFDKPCGSMEWNELVSATLSITTEATYDDADLVLVGIMAPEAKDDDDEEEEEEEESEDDTPSVSITGSAAKELDNALGGALSDLMIENAKAFKNGAKAGSTTPTLRMAKSPGSKAKRYILVGLGKPPKEDDDDSSTTATAFKLGQAIASKCNDEKKVTKCTVLLPESYSADSATLKDVSTALYSSLYSDNRYRTGAKIKPSAPDLTSITIAASKSQADHDAAGAQASLDAGKTLATGVFLTKDIVNSPHNVLNSLSLADTAQRIADQSKGRIKCTILNKRDCEKRGMGAYLGVARGSETEPQFIHLTYTPENSSSNDKKVGIIGKGLLFDTGGYNIKTQMMELMKFDCGGSAAVLGAARAIAALKPQGVEAHFIVAACENMISERAMVPSDILTASNGKTIEIGNTDAEGRLTLADALVFADKEVGCESIIELSTLTGACMISLGKQIAGVWTANDDLAKELEDISKATGDKSWRMPLAAEYNEQIESKVADLKNVGNRYGGAITAALFLQHFVSKKKPFAHIDIAGPVWSDKTGATGFGAKLVAEWVRRQGSNQE